MKVGIVGGGIAGICAAIVAQRNGANVTIIDAAPHLGGRAAGKGNIDTGRHLVTTAYANFLQLTNILNSTDQLALIPQAYGSFEKNRIPFWQINSNIPGSAGQAISLLKSGLIPFKDWISSLIALNRTQKFKPDTGKENGIFYHLNETSIGDFFRNTHWPDSLLEKIAKPLAMGIMNGDIDTTSIEPFHHALMLMLNDPDKMAGWIRGDYGSLITTPALTYCESNEIDLHLRTRVKGIKKSDKSWIIETADDDKNEMQFDSLILTLPPWQLRNLEVSEELVSLKVMASLVRANSIVTTRAKTNKLEALPGPISEGPPHYGIWFFEPSDKGILIERVVSAIDPEKIPKSEVFREVFSKKLKKQFNLEIENKIEVRPYKYATPLLSPKTPRPEISIGDGLFYAGDWANIGLPATLEGAALAGWQAGEVCSKP